MDTCFLFAEHLNDLGCYGLKINQEGLLLSQPTHLSFEDIKTLQANCRTIVVESTVNATLLELELPWLPERKARLAIPFALEDKLAQSVDELHFAFDKLRYQNNHYLISIIAKQRLSYIMQLLDQYTINFDLITLDWFALETDECCIIEKKLLINQEQFKGALTDQLALHYLSQSPLLAPIKLNNSPHLPNESSTEINQELYLTWIAKRLLKKVPMNLCQGAMQHGNAEHALKTGYRIAGVCALLWLVSILVVNAISLSILNKKTTKLDEQIAVIYHQFFPQAKQVISPKFRIGQLLNNKNQEDHNKFWFLLNQFSKIMDESKVSIQQLRYQNNNLSVTVLSPDFSNLEHLENMLKKARLNVNQTEAATHEQQVIATLELS